MSDELRERVRAAERLVFVCSGNMVRSAFAELYARHVLELATPVVSCATTYRNERLYPATERALAVRGVPAEELLAFRPTFVTELELLDGDLLLGMRRGHLEDLARLGAEGFLLGALLEPGLEIADPVMEDVPFERVFDQVARAVDALGDELGR